LKRFSFVL